MKDLVYALSVLQGYQPHAVGTRQSEPMPVTETKNRPFASLRMTGCALTADLLLFELHHQLFPFGCEQTMLLAERIEQARQPFGFFCADENAKRLFCICDGSLDPWNFFFHKGEPFLHLPQANGIEAADFFFFFPDDWSGYRRSRLLDWSGNDGLNCIRTALLAPQIVLIVSGIDMHMTAFYLEHARSQPVDEVAVMGNKDHGAGELIYGVEQYVFGMEIEVICWLIEQEKICRADQNARQRIAIAFAAGEHT